MMETQAGDPVAFAEFDLNRVESPAFVVDAAKLRANCQILADIRDHASEGGGGFKVLDWLNRLGRPSQVKELDGPADF